METKKKSPSYLTEEDLSVLGEIDIISDFDETFSQTCVRHGVVLYEDEENMIPVQITFQGFCKDNPTNYCE